MAVLLGFAVWMLILGLAWFLLGQVLSSRSMLSRAVQARKARAREVNDRLAADDQQLPRPLDDEDRRGFGHEGRDR